MYSNHTVKKNPDIADLMCCWARLQPRHSGQHDGAGCREAQLIFYHPHPSGIIIPSKWGSSEHMDTIGSQ